MRKLGLAELEPVDRELILLVAWDELTPSEAGHVLGLRSVTARSRLHRARRRLHGLLEQSAGTVTRAPAPASSPRSPASAPEERPTG